MDIGTHTLCLKTKDLDQARAFYEALGMKVNLVMGEVHVNADSGTLNLSLMNFLEENCLNFRGADVWAVYKMMREQGFDLEGEPREYKAHEHGPAGVCWETRDPDGNYLFFDTNESDTVSHRAGRLVERIERELEMLGVNSEHFDAFAQELRDLK